MKGAEKPKACLRRELIEELRPIGWFSYEEVAELAVAHQLQMGFELAAISEFRRWHAGRR